jgi:hypothetical protein
MNITRTLLYFAVLEAALMVGCSTPTTRIRANPQAFASLSPADQALVRKGQIREGFDMETVRLALGNPDWIERKTDLHGQMQTWHYEDGAGSSFQYAESSETPDPVHGNAEGDSPRLAGIMNSFSYGKAADSAEPSMPTRDDRPTVIVFRSGKVDRIIY